MGGNILLMKIKVKYPAGQNLEMKTFRYLKTLIFDKPFKSYNIIWCFYFWRVLWLIANLLLYDYSTLSPHISLSPHSFQENWHDHKKFSRFYPILSPPPHPPLSPPHCPDWGRRHGVLKRDFIWRKDVMNWSFVGTKKV